jgi:hypothetical protein
MTQLSFILTIEGADVMTDAAQNALYEAGCDDATFGVSGGIRTAESDREAAEFAEAVRKRHPGRGIGRPGRPSGRGSPGTRRRCRRLRSGGLAVGLGRVEVPMETEAVVTEYLNAGDLNELHRIPSLRQRIDRQQWLVSSRSLPFRLSADVPKSANVQARDSPADHQLLDLLGALEEVVDPERLFANIRKRPLSRDDVPRRCAAVRARSLSCRDESRDDEGSEPPSR